MILRPVKKYLAIGVLVSLLGVGLYAGFLKLQNEKQDATIKQKEIELSVVVGKNKGLSETIQQIEDDKKKSDQQLLKREDRFQKLEEEYEKKLATIARTKEDKDWSRSVLVPCPVANKLFPASDINCRPQDDE